MPSPSPEMGGYQRREVQPVSPEQAPQPNVEAQPNTAEHEPRLEAQQQVPIDPVTVIPALPAHLIPAPAATQQAQSGPLSTDASMVANDEDLIEREWIDKAKKIVEQTKTDPYQQEKEVSKLQADYIKKRYGKDVKLADE